MPEKTFSIVEHSNISRLLTAEGAVLLENSGVLPIGKTGSVALFGSGAFHTRASAGGHGPGGGPGGPGPGGPGGPGEGPGPDAPAPMPQAAAVEKLPGFHENISDALVASGYELLTDENGLVSDKTPDYVIYVLRRDSAEGSDRKDEKGDYYLSDGEVADLTELAEKYGKVILLLNCCAVTDFYTTVAKINEKTPDGIAAVMYIGLGGEGFGDAVVSLLRGDVNPSGKLVDTWALDYMDYPSAATFGEKGHVNFASFGDNEYYFEDIYNGYRYFDTFNVPVAYPFGYGLSYTSFEIVSGDTAVSEHDVTITAKVTNTGTVPGKEVVQVYGSYYYEPGMSKLETPYQTLVGYRKTKLLAPGESETVEIRFPLSALSSFDEETDCFILQKGQYFIRVGNGSRNTLVAAVLEAAEEAVLEQCTPGIFEIKNDDRLPGDDAEILRAGKLTYAKITRPELTFKTWEPGTAPKLSIPVEKIIKKDSVSRFDPTTVTTLVSTDESADSHKWAGRETANYTGRTEVYKTVDTLPNGTLLDVAEGRITMEQFVAGLSTLELADIVTGLSSEQTAYLLDQNNPVLAVCREGVSGYQGTKNLVTHRFIPQVYQADGPESPGITLSNDEIWAGQTDNSQKSTAYSAVMLPSGTVMAQSFNPELMRKMGQAVGDEMIQAGLSIWLAPGANIHRNPLGGRNYQYYSEDPFVSGTMLTAEVSGVESRGGVFCCAKHFAANNMETNRGEVNEVISERALREIYLAGWRMCAESQYPNAAFMSAYNQINGTYCGESYDLLTHLIRGEWKWDGFVMDDYTPWFFLCWRDLTICPQIGNDLVMPGNTANNVMPVPFIPLENPVTKMEYEGVTAPFQSDTYLMMIALRDGKLLLGDLQKSAAAILKVYMQTEVFQEIAEVVKGKNIQPS